MDKRPVLLRTFIVVIAIVFFALAVYPLKERDYYEVFTEMLRDKNDKDAAAIITDAKAIQAKDASVFQSQALLQAAEKRGVVLADKIKDSNGLTDNRDVLSLIRKNASGTIRLGLDLAGGVEFFLELDDKDAPDEVKSQFDRYRDIAIETLRTRLESQNIFEAEISPSGSKYISLRAPIVAKDEKLKLLNLIKMSAKLRFRLVHQDNDRLIAEYVANPATFRTPLGYEIMEMSDQVNGKVVSTPVLVSRKVEMEGKDITYAAPAKDQFGQRSIQLRFNRQGAEDFARVTGANVDRRLAIVLDGKLYCAPSIRGAISGGQAEISGRFSEEEAKSISDALVSGNFPFEIKVNAIFDTDPKLGADHISSGIWGCLISMICVAVFMLIYYRFSGLIAVTALVLNIVLILGAMAAFSCTLTLPGIAGIVLTIGMAVDANVLIYERIREELERGKSLRMAVDQGYGKAMTAVVDSNLTTLLTSIILMYVGTGAVKGFAVTLSIGILASLFTAVFVTRLIYDYLFRFTGFNRISMLAVFRNSKFNFVKFFRKSIWISVALLLLAAGVLIYRGKSILGVDFTGGTVITFNYAKQISSGELQSTLAKAGYDEPTVTYKHNMASADDAQQVEILIRGDLSEKAVGQSPKDMIEALLNKTYPDAKFTGGQESSVGGLIGWEFTKAAILAVFFSLIGIGLYIAFRYEYVYATTAVVMLIHDVLVVMGIYLAMGRTISLSAVASLLTVIGYSINDKVVIFDRIRENHALNPSESFPELVNSSVNQTLSRTTMTSLTTFIVVFVLFLGGGVAINDFVLIMMLGVIFGTYSSIFIAAPGLSYWQDWRYRRKAAKAKMEVK